VASALGEPIVGPGSDRGMVFQDYALFPWMTVRQNVGFGPRQQVAAIADEFVKLVGLERFADRYPSQLSGAAPARCRLAGIQRHPPRCRAPADKLSLDADEIVMLSPLKRLAVRAPPLILFVGSAELPELKRQSEVYARAASALGLPCSLTVLRGHHHFSILDELADPNGALTRALLEPHHAVGWMSTPLGSILRSGAATLRGSVAGRVTPSPGVNSSACNVAMSRAAMILA
jgi:acetyl esterase/lipase